MQVIPVIIGAHPWMDNQFLKWISVIHIQNIRKTLVVFNTYTRLDRNFNIILYKCILKHCIQKTVQFFCITQHSRTLVLGDHCSGGTSRIQINLAVPIFFIKHLCCPDEIPGFIGHHLYYNIYSLIMFTVYVTNLPCEEIL